MQGITLLIRTLPGADVLASLRESVARIDSTVNLIDPQSMEERINRFTAPMRMAAWTYGAVGVFSLVLAAVGLAGLTAYSVARRTRELGIRMALGARPGQVMALVTRESIVLVVIGTLLGMVIALAGTRLLSAMNATVGRVTGTNTADPFVLIGAPAVLALVSVPGVLHSCTPLPQHQSRIHPKAGLRMGTLQTCWRETHRPGIELFRHYLSDFLHIEALGGKEGAAAPAYRSTAPIRSTILSGDIACSSQVPAACRSCVSGAVSQCGTR